MIARSKKKLTIKEERELRYFLSETTNDGWNAAIDAVIAILVGEHEFTHNELIHKVAELKK